MPKERFICEATFRGDHPSAAQVRQGRLQTSKGRYPARRKAIKIILPVFPKLSFQNMISRIIFEMHSDKRVVLAAKNKRTGEN
jgi:hypothetical protein